MSIEDALLRAQWTIKAPSMAVLLAPLLAFILAAQWHLVPSKGPRALAWFLPLFLGGFVAGWLVWSVQVPRWRSWAYRRVDGIATLKRAAAARQLIWPEGHWFEKTEIMSAALRQRLRELETACEERHRECSAPIAQRARE